MEVRKLLGKRIKKLRNDRLLTQEQFAELIGMQPQTVRSIESGLRFMSESTLNAVVNVFQISYSDLFNFEDIDTSCNKALLAELNTLSEEECKYFIKSIRAYKDLQKSK